MLLPGWLLQKTMEPVVLLLISSGVSFVQALKKTDSTTAIRKSQKFFNWKSLIGFIFFVFGCLKFMFWEQDKDVVQGKGEATVYTRLIKRILTGIGCVNTGFVLTQKTRCKAAGSNGKYYKPDNGNILWVTVRNIFKLVKSVKNDLQDGRFLLSFFCNECLEVIKIPCGYLFRNAHFFQPLHH